MKDKKELGRTIKFILFSISAGVIQALAIVVFNLIIKNPVTLFGKEFLPNQISYFIGLVLSVIWNFTFNRRFTFQSANNIPKAMMLVFLFYLVFTPFSTWLVGILEKAGLSKLICDGGVMVLNLLLEYLYDRFVVFRNSIDTNDLAEKKKETASQ